MDKAHPFLIAGGGIGGLAAALALAREGVCCIVLERAPVLDEIGAGIQIGPNALRCLDLLGVGGTARAVAVHIDTLHLMDGVSGREVCHIPLDDRFRAHFGCPYVVVHRGDLHRVLLDACRRSDLIALRTAHGARAYQQRDGDVRLSFNDRPAVTGAALIGADGIRSAIRAQLIGDGPPRVSGHTAYRCVIPADRMPREGHWNAATLWAGPKCHIVHYPLRGGTVFNLVVTCHNDVTQAVAGKPVTRDEVLHGFRHLHPRARRIIEQGQDWTQWVLCDRDPDDRWTDGRVTLLGDAAHPMLPYFAQGACMALEDAVCLARLVARRPTVEQAFAAYRSARFARTARVQLGARLVGEHVYHATGGIAAARNAILSTKTPQDWFRDLDWLYGARAA